MKDTRLKMNEVKKTIVKLAFMAARVEANTACPYFGYQREEPKQIKEMRKF